MVKNPPAMQETWVRSLHQEDPLEKGMATHSSILVWRIPWTEEPSRLQSMGLQRVEHNWVTFTIYIYIHILYIYIHIPKVIENNRCWMCIYWMLLNKGMPLVCACVCVSMHVCVYIHTYIFFSLKKIFYGLSQEIGYGFLCYTIRPCFLSILNAIVFIYQPQIPSPSLSFTPSPPWQP